MADTIGRKLGLAKGTMLETPWNELDGELQKLWLWGTGDEHITFTWRSGPQGHKYGGKFEGIIPDLLDKHRNSQSKMQLRQLEKYMHVMPCEDCHGARLNPQARAVTVTTRHSQVCRSAIAVVARGLFAAGQRCDRVFHRTRVWTPRVR